ncbi:MAG TPA: glycosyltransferase family 1 protein [Candidatus Binataceae bacterium]|nr:glycosyltransferase family 1 protein [Candidatus Binataceae bacterium]
MPQPLRVAVVCDFRQEGWPSIDLVGAMTVRYLARYPHQRIHARPLRPPFRRRFTRLPAAGWACVSADRLLNRMFDYPRYLRRMHERFDLFHIIDHSYSHLLHELPRGTAAVTCHDLETFRCLLEPDRQPRSLPFRAMTRRILDGFGRAAVVLCVSDSTRAEVLRNSLAPAARLTTVYHGVHPSFGVQADPRAQAQVDRLLGPAADHPYLLHVGSTSARKRVDILLRIVAGLRRRWPDLRLVRVGGPFTPAQVRLRDELSLKEAVVVLPRLTTAILAAIYQRAVLTLLTSDYEGFGLPLIESQACATPVVASDLPVCREIGGPAAHYCKAAEVESWVEEVDGILVERAEYPQRWQARREAARSWSRSFTWERCAAQTLAEYEKLAPALIH